MNHKLSQPTIGFGTFKGVYTPSLLTILGVIMYLRMGWIVSQVGLLETLAIVTLASAITFFTALSIAATATNMKVEGGGAYYMISRSLGLEAGAAIGLPLFLAQALGISFYLVGFAESLHAVMPAVPEKVLSLVGLVLLTVLAWVSANLALKVQFFVLLLIIGSLISFFYGALWGDHIHLLEARSSSVPKEGFWKAFAIFFPAVTGIEAGLAMSGDLKNPSKSLPVGTIAAVLSGYIIYMLIPIVLFRSADISYLSQDPLVMAKISVFSELVFIGICGATLSSALGALLGAPRTLVALSKDRVVPGFLSKLWGSGQNPRYATIVAFMVALVGIMLGDLNAIAPILAMFFLTSYGVLNLTAGLEELIANPAWRPEFRVPWWVSILGAFGCFAAMFMINAGATFIAIFLIVGVYVFMEKRQLKAHWGDMRHGILMLLARYSIYRLAEIKPNPRSWRPNVLVLSGAPSNRWYLIELADAITHGKGFLTVASVILKKDNNT